ncbi:RidA family protein [Uliginosibacterium paludis]|uniref:RidA family protein n=1 Tax=Uliginosibacterium paludis TaxID=1615952 RepID=A0ABV2CSJ9_9RHOO
MSRDERFRAEALALGYSFEGEIRIGGHYSPLVRDGDTLHVSGQIPRVGDEVVVTGAAGEAVDLDRARLAAKICVLRALALIQRSLGSLDQVRRIPGMSVFVQSARHFTQQSEVADAASGVLFNVLGEAGEHARTSVGVYQLPKNATVEVSLIASVA